MSMQSDLRNPELGYFDEGLDLTSTKIYADLNLPFGEARDLPSVAHRSKVFSELENEKVWTREWVAVGLTQQIPNAGDLLPITIGFHGIHVQRNVDGTLSARLNRHQHGGCRFVPEQCRTGNQTKCTINSCNYTRDSDIIIADENGEQTDAMYKFIGLVPERLISVKCDTWGPFIFVNLDPESSSLSKTIDNFSNHVGNIFEQDWFLLEKKWVDFSSNWKSVGASLVANMVKGHTNPEIEDDINDSQIQFSHYIPTDERDCLSLRRGKISWLFPNLIMITSLDVIAVALLQSTGPSRCLVRGFILQRDATKKSGVDDWFNYLFSTKIVAEQMHQELINWGTSCQPDTHSEMLPIQNDYNKYLLNRFLSKKLTQNHKYYWNAPIMDAAMTMRR